MFAVDDNNLSNITVNFVYANDQTIQLENLLQCEKNASIEYSKAIVQNQCVCVWKGIQRRQQIESQLLRGIVYKKMQQISFGVFIEPYEITLDTVGKNALLLYLHFSLVQSNSS